MEVFETIQQSQRVIRDICRSTRGGAGDVLEPEHNVAAIGSGGNYALAAARGMMNTKKSAEAVAREAMAIAADICVYTNGNLTIETL